MIYKDQVQWYDAWVADLDLHGQKHNSEQVYKMLQRLGRRKKASHDGPRPLPLLRRPNGEAVSTHQEMQEAWCEQFSKTEAGVPIEEQDLVDLHLEPDLMPSHLIDPSLIPSLQQIVHLVRAAKNGKVAGPNQIVAEALKAGGDSLAMHLLPIITKATLHAREPLAWKGGVLIPLFKGRGDPRQLESYRSIFVSDGTAKIHHKWLRKQLEVRWAADEHSLQLGGKAGIGCDMAHHCVQAAVAWMRSRGMSYSSMFLDLKAAFYSVHRGTLFEGEWDDRLLCFAMEQHGILPSDWHDIRAQIQADNATNGLSDHAERVFRDMFHPTYFTMANIAQPILTCRGTRPGDPVGDILFNMLFGIILKQSRQEFLQRTEFEWIGRPGVVQCFSDLTRPPDRGLLDLAYVDDAVFMLYSPHAGDLLAATQHLASIIHDVSRQRGLDVNYAQGKTEVMLRLAGKGSYALKQKVWHEMQGKLPVVTELSSQQLSFVRSYKHLGTVVQEHAAPVKEISQRNTEARKAEGRTHRSFFSKKNVSLATKTQVFQATVLSKHRYNMHTLSWITDKDLARWEDGIRETVGVLCRHKLGRIPAFKLQTKSLCALANLLPPSDGLHVTRLKYCRKLVFKGPSCLWSMLLDTEAKQSWIHALLSSIRWLARFGPPECRNFPERVEDVIACIAVDDRFAAKVTAAKHSCMSYRAQQALAQIKQMELSMVLEKCGCDVEGPKKAEPQWSCSLCSACFGSKRGLALHSVQVHGYKRRARFWVANDECLVCKKKYYTRARAILHFQSSPGCLDRYMACFAPMSHDEVQHLDALEHEVSVTMKQQGWWATKALVPISPLPGPSLPLADSAEAQLMRQWWDGQQQENEWAFQCMEGVRMTNEEGGLPESTDDHILPYVGHSNGGRWEGYLGVFAMAGLGRICAQVNLKSKVFLHIFSGYRRHLDLQDQLEAIREDGTMIHCVSLDICLTRENADMLSPGVVKYWKNKMKDGWVAGVGGGPPCETYTAARHQPGGPPPLRSYDEPWGLPHLRPKQWRQVQTGTALVFSLLELLYTAAVLGLAGFLEHPAYPLWIARLRPASVWMWAAVRQLSRLACVQATTFDQCVHGCDGRKPTTVLAVRLPRFRELVMMRGEMGRCHHRHKHVALIGKDAKGGFRTERAKIYPALLNQDLAQAIQAYLKVTTSESCTQIPEFLAQVPAAAYVHKDHVQKDYHGD